MTPSSPTNSQSPHERFSTSPRSPPSLDIVFHSSPEDLPITPTYSSSSPDLVDPDGAGSREQPEQGTKKRRPCVSTLSDPRPRAGQSTHPSPSPSSAKRFPGPLSPFSRKTPKVSASTLASRFTYTPSEKGLYLKAEDGCELGSTILTCAPEFKTLHSGLLKSHCSGCLESPRTLALAKGILGTGEEIFGKRFLECGRCASVVYCSAVEDQDSGPARWRCDGCNKIGDRALSDTCFPHLSEGIEMEWEMERRGDVGSLSADDKVLREKYGQLDNALDSLAVDFPDTLYPVPFLQRRLARYVTAMKAPTDEELATALNCLERARLSLGVWHDDHHPDLAAVLIEKVFAHIRTLEYLIKEARSPLARCYLLTHAHLDHALSLILLSGSIPPRRETTAPAVRTPVYATKETLSKLALAYGGTLWPELGKWEENGGKGRKRRKLGKEEPGNEPGVMFCPVTASKTHRPIHPTLPITSLTFPVAHGCTSHGLYESSAMFIRYDPSSMERKPIDGEDGGSEFLFFGDVESDYRAEGEEEVGKEIGLQAKELNKVVWEEAAKSWKEGRLTGIFIECSYDSSRPAHLMFGHLSPPGLYHELRTLASLVSDTIRPLDGLTIYVTHIKEYLVPHPSGKSAYEVILSELDALETGPLGNLGVNFRTIKKGDRVLL
ncbi:hypothetical protein P7C73_g5988, partial [Tremellales sp. Uapishka_1]